MPTPQTPTNTSGSRVLRKSATVSHVLVWKREGSSNVRWTKEAVWGCQTEGTPAFQASNHQQLTAIMPRNTTESVERVSHRDFWKTCLPTTKPLANAKQKKWLASHRRPTSRLGPRLVNAIIFCRNQGSNSAIRRIVWKQSSPLIRSVFTEMTTLLSFLMLTRDSS